MIKMDTMSKAIRSKDLKFENNIPMWRVASVHSGFWSIQDISEVVG